MKSAPEAALKARLATLAGVPKAWPNIDFDPSASGNLPYLACEIVRVATSDDTLEGVAPIITARLIATAVTLRGSGETRANQIAEQVEALFPMGLRIPSNDITEIIVTQPPHIREGMSDGAYWRVPVTVPIQIITKPAP